MPGAPNLATPIRSIITKYLAYSNIGGILFKGLITTLFRHSFKSPPSSSDCCRTRRYINRGTKSIFNSASLCFIKRYLLGLRYLIWLYNTKWWIVGLNKYLLAKNNIKNFLNIFFSNFCIPPLVSGWLVNCRRYRQLCFRQLNQEYLFPYLDKNCLYGKYLFIESL